MPTAEERRIFDQIAREKLISDNRAKFTKNRIVYVTPNGIHIAHDVENIDELINALREAKFECRATTQSEQYMTNDWFKHGEADCWESYVITKK